MIWLRNVASRRLRRRLRLRLPLIVPLVLYQGAAPWRFDREFAGLVTAAAPERRWVPRFEHLLIDQTRQRARLGVAAVTARLARVAMMATFARRSRS